MANARIGKGWASQDHDLYVLGRLNKLVLGGDLYYAHSTAPGHFVDAYRVMAINNTDRLDLGEWHFSGMNTSLNLDVLKARTDAMNWKHTNPGIAHRHHLRLHDLYFGNEFILAGGVPAFSTSTRISSLAWFTDIDLVLATDFTRLLPSLRFSYPLARRDELLRAYPWAVQPPVMKQALAPLDLQFHYQKQFPTVAAGAAGGDMSRGINLSIAHRFAYLYNKPVLIDGGFASLPLLSFSDQWENHTSVRLSGMLQGFALSQSLSLDVIHTKYNNFRLRHYSPLLSAVTNVTHSFGDLETGLSFTQEYLAQDHLGKKLNHVFKMDIIAGYNVTPDLAIYARILDVFNSPGKVWNSIPGTGREAFLGVKYRVR